MNLIFSSALHITHFIQLKNRNIQHCNFNLQYSNPSNLIKTSVYTETIISCLFDFVSLKKGALVA
jgi:hypothetical protein